MKKEIVFGSFLTGLLLLITPCVVSMEHQNQKTFQNQKMELVPHSLFYIALGDFNVDGNDVIGEAKILFSVSMKYFIFPQPYIEFNTKFGAPIISDFYDYYRILYTHHIVFIFAIYR